MLRVSLTLVIPAKRNASLALFDATLARGSAGSLAKLSKTAIAPISLGLSHPLMQPARRARFAPRHFGLIISFALCVLLPAAVAGWYLWARAADQYASTLGFSVRKEKVSSAIELLGGFTNLTGSSSADTDILYDYMHSQKLVSDIDASLDLRAMWSKPDRDPIFAFAAPGSIETLVEFWSHKVQVTYNNATRLIEIRVLAFDPADAQAIAVQLFEKSTAMINQLNDAAQADAFSIDTPTNTHFEIARDLLAQGKHVLVEKPMTETSAQAAELVDLAHRHGAVLQVGHVERFNPAF